MTTDDRFDAQLDHVNAANLQDLTDDVEWLTSEEQHFWQLIVSTFRSVERKIELRLRDKAGLSFADFTVLIALNETTEGIMHVDQLCERLTWNHSRARLHVNRMEKRGAISVEEVGVDPDADYTIVLTGVGRHLLVEFAPDYVDTVRSEVFQPVTSTDVSNVTACFNRIMENARAEDALG